MAREHRVADASYPCLLSDEGDPLEEGHLLDGESGQPQRLFRKVTAIYHDQRTLTSSQPAMSGARLISQRPATSKVGDRAVVGGPHGATCYLCWVAVSLLCGS